MSRLPTPTELSSEFWTAAAEHRLVVPRCDRCAAEFFPPERLCPACGSPEWGYVGDAGAGTVTSFTVVHRAPSPDFETPYVVAVVELAGGCSLLTNLVQVDPADVASGMPVEVVFIDKPDGGALPVFAPGPGDPSNEIEKE